MEADHEAVAAEVASVDDAPMDSPVVIGFGPIAWSFVVRHNLYGVVLRIVEDAPDAESVPEYVASLLRRFGACDAELDDLRLPEDLATYPPGHSAPTST